MDIKTNEKANHSLKDALKMRGDNISLYALQIIEELEQLALCNVSKSFYCYNKEKGFNNSLCKVKQCQKCKKVDKQCSNNMFD